MRKRKIRFFILIGSVCFGAYLGFAALAGCFMWFKTGEYDYDFARRKIERQFTYEGGFHWEHFLQYAQAVFRNYQQARKEAFARKLESRMLTLEVLVFLRDSEITGDITPLIPFLKEAKDYFWPATGGTFGLWPFKGEWYGVGPFIRGLCDDVLRRYGMASQGS